MFLRIFDHLLPDAAAWRLTASKRLRAFFKGLGEGAPAVIRAHLDAVFDDLYPARTREIERWEEQFALVSTGTTEERRARIDAAWKSTGGQSPRYLQDILHANGFTDLYVHEWWSNGPAPYIARDPRNYTDQPLIGTHQCGQVDAVCGARDEATTPLCNAFLVNDPHYLVNLNWTPKAPPPIPDDPDRWPYFVYICGETFGTFVSVPNARRRELEELLLKLFPQHLWIVTMTTYVTPSGLTWTLLEDPAIDWTLLEDGSTPWTTL